jgi:hypothetical protein
MSWAFPLGTQPARSQPNHPEGDCSRCCDDDPLLGGARCERDPGEGNGEQQEERTERAALRGGGHTRMVVAAGEPLVPPCTPSLLA